ncbi:MAG: hypothetical protein HZA78_08800 [Candidatus Schekmanbacteria bacterium]|nr:hypothetical protein [Candidatus Schekmanbacteria bacterium]
MDKWPKQILAEKEHVETALNNLNTAMARKEKTVIELSAIATFIHNVYNGIENIIKQVLSLKHIDIPKSAMWHKDLLNIAKSQGVISEKLSDRLFEYLTFRHFFVHAYGFMLEESPLMDLADNIPNVWEQFLSETERFVNK